MPDTAHQTALAIQRDQQAQEDAFTWQLTGTGLLTGLLIIPLVYAWVCWQARRRS